jgi:cytochrome c oxidase cbb3-type subunit 1
MQGLMWRAYNEFGFLEYSFVESVEAMHPYYIIRTAGGLLFLLGALIMAYNLWRTATGPEPAHVRATDIPAQAAPVAAE